MALTVDTKLNTGGSTAGVYLWNDYDGAPTQQYNPEIRRRGAPVEIRAWTYRRVYFPLRVDNGVLKRWEGERERKSTHAFVILGFTFLIILTDWLFDLIMLILYLLCYLAGFLDRLKAVGFVCYQVSKVLSPSIINSCMTSILICLCNFSVLSPSYPSLLLSQMTWWWFGTLYFGRAFPTPSSGHAPDRTCASFMSLGLEGGILKYNPKQRCLSLAVSTPQSECL